jgi:hypothetical protein
MSAAVAGTTFRPTPSYTTLRDVTPGQLSRGNREGKKPRQSGRSLTFVDASAHPCDRSPAQQSPSKWLNSLL